FQYYLAVRSVLRDGAPAGRVRDEWQQMHDTMPRGARLLHYTDNHDWPRSVVQYGEKASEAANILDFTLDGIPFVYDGQEVADPTATHWRGHAPIRWKDTGNSDDEKSIEATEAFYRKLFAMRAAEPALTSGDVIWINNTEPESVLSFLRKEGNDEVLVILNLSNRQVHVTIDLPVMDYWAVQNLLTPDKTWFQLYSGRVSANLDAFGYVVGKKIPLEPLKKEPE
ncbi:MAG TPA: alpha-amylase family glycosyl hydrolase, partial [Acidobacteriaceae bacterium]|nr:alpha-amylase family glycosyl hydrolase [Acidobacteriaceae bacterium]